MKHKENNTKTVICKAILDILDIGNKQKRGHTYSIKTEVLLGTNVAGC